MGHIFHPAGKDKPGFAEEQGFPGQGDGLEPRSAGHVDGEGGFLDRDSGPEEDLPGRVGFVSRLARLPQDHFVKSLLPLIAGQTAEHRDAVFAEGGRRLGERQAMELESLSSNNPQGLYYPRLRLQTTDDGPPYHTKATMCRTREYKYVRRLYEPDELYDLRKDPGELRNVAGDRAYADVLDRLKERMLRWYQETCDIVPRETDKRN